MYRIALLALTPYLVLRTWLRSRRDGGPRYLRQRLGFGLPRLAVAPLWLHCASVGEVNAAAPLVHRLLAANPGVPLLVTTNTASGARTAARRLPGECTHAYLPLDWRFATGRFLSRCRPRAALIMETEIWPNLYALARRGGCAPVIVNARLSSRSRDVPGWVRRAQASALDDVAAVLARNEEDASAYRELGVPASRVTVCGNLKFAAAASPREETPPSPVAAPFWLAASTHAPEERYCAQVQHAHPDLPLLVVVPRYPERGAAVVAELRRVGFEAARRGLGEPPSPGTRVYVADTLGELGSFLAHAELVFMGGSLMRRGGQNILEAARHACPTVVGPNMENFADETRRLLAAGALAQVADAAGLATCISTLLRDPARRAAMAAAQRRTLAREGRVAERYLAELRRVLPDVFAAR